MATNSMSGQHLAVFRQKLRKLQDKGKPSNNELLGLFFDLYEVFMVMADDMRETLGDAMMGATMMKMDKETFEKMVGGSDKKSKTEDAKGKGQYL